jgi:hypothetical protein
MPVPINSTLALPFPASVTAITIFAVFTKLRRFAERIEALLTEIETVFPASKNSVADEIPNAARASAALLDPVPPCSMETIVVI